MTSNAGRQVFTGSRSLTEWRGYPWALQSESGRELSFSLTLSTTSLLPATMTPARWLAERPGRLAGFQWGTLPPPIPRQRVGAPRNCTRDLTNLMSGALVHEATSTPDSPERPQRASAWRCRVVRTNPPPTEQGRSLQSMESSGHPASPHQTEEGRLHRVPEWTLPASRHPSFFQFEITWTPTPPWSCP